MVNSRLCVQPGLLGSYSHFRDEFEVPIEKHIGDENIILLKNTTYFQSRTYIMREQRVKN